MTAIKHYRKQKHMSQQELGDAIGVKAISISRYERGERKLSVDKAKQIGKALDTDWTLLFVDVETGEKAV